MSIAQVVGQGMGMLAVVLGFACFQMRTQKKLLILQTLSIVAFCLHYYLIGAVSGLVTNIIGIVRNMAYYHREKGVFSGRWVPVFFAILLGVGGLFSWEGFETLFVVAGVVIHTLCLSLKDPQMIRRSVLVSSPLLLIYNILVLSIGGIVFEAAAILSSLIGLWRCSREKKA